MKDVSLINMLATAKENLKAGRERAEAKADAWKAVTFPTKKDGSEFAVLSKNFDHCRIAIKEYSNYEDQKEIKVWGRTVTGELVVDAINSYETINPYIKCERAEAHPERVKKYEPYLKAIYIKSVSDLKEDIQKQIDYWTGIADGYAEAEAKVDTDLMELVVGISDAVEKFKSGANRILQAEASDLVKKEWWSIFG